MMNRNHWLGCSDGEWWSEKPQSWERVHELSGLLTSRDVELGQGQFIVLFWISALARMHGT